MGQWQCTLQQLAVFSWMHQSRSKGRIATIAGWGAGVMSSAHPRASPGVSVLYIWFLPWLAGQPGCLHAGWSHRAHVRTRAGALDIRLLGAVLKWELISSWKWQVTICYAYCKDLKTNACVRCNPVCFSEPRGKSSHTILCASFVVSIVFPCLWKMLAMCDILSNFKRNWTFLLLRGR